jgi:hypothetical protein
MICDEGFEAHCTLHTWEGLHSSKVRFEKEDKSELDPNIFKLKGLMSQERV